MSDPICGPSIHNYEDVTYFDQVHFENSGPRRNNGGYMRRLRRLYEEKENARDRSVPDGSNKYSCGQH